MGVDPDHGLYGAGENAVKPQIRIAVPVYVLVAIVRNRLELGASLYRTPKKNSTIPAS